MKVLGDPSFVGTAGNPLAVNSVGPNVVEGRELSTPLGIALDTSVSPPLVYIADSANNRVLGYQYATQLKPGATADLVLGQVDFFGNQAQAGAGRSGGLSLPTGLVVDKSGNLYVADTGNNRILRYPKPLSQGAGFAFPDLVIGQTSLSGKTSNAGGISATSLALSAGNRTGLALDASGNLWVADSGNNRVLRFPASVLKAQQTNPAADLVLGQADFVSHVGAATRMTKTALIGPLGLTFDPAGRLLVTDGGSRVVVYAAGAVSSAPAIRILGVDTTTGAGPTTQISVNAPFGVAATAAGVIVTDTVNNRLLVFPPVDSWSPESTQFSPSAIAVLGQPSYTVAKSNQGAPDASATSFSSPVDAASSGPELFVADAGNNRILVFSNSPTGVTSTASRVIGQLDFPYNAQNLIEGKEFGTAFSGGVAGSAILDESATPPHLYVADTRNNRILGFNDFAHAQNGQKADLVIGQPDFLRSQINYPTNDGTQPNAQGLHAPTSLTVDSAGNLYVTDTGNSRVLRFPAPFASGKTALETADLVIGQASFNSITTDATERTMNAPIGLALTADAANASVANSGWLVVSDVIHHRVLFFQKPFSSGMSATKVLGSLNFTSTASSSDPPRFNGPRGVAVDPQDRVLVADTGNHRVQIFNKAANINNFDTPPISITSANGLNSPFSITTNSSGFWVADFGQNQLLHFPPPDQLIIRSNAADAAQPALFPQSGYLDRYGNLLVADGVNRVLYFTPGLSLVNAANGSTRPLAPGAIASIYPAAVATGVMPGVVAAGTDSATSVPLPVALSDTQVLVNGKAAPLFFVSPGQINLELPNGLSGGGTADVQVTRVSTGQIYGGAELALAAASPALFTANQSGAGQVSALNFNADGTFGGVNSPSNPVQRGATIVLYGTGVGSISTAPPDGQAAPGAAPASDLPQVLLGASATAFLPAANVTYSGLAPTLVGVWQVNVLIPSDGPTGSSVPIKLFEQSIPSVDPSGTLGSTTIAIK